jgi:hypothetical protein
MKVGPTSANSCPARLVFRRTPGAKARLLPALSPGNVDKTPQAPVTAIIGYDTRFYEWNFLCNLGHGDPSKVLAKLPRLDFEEAGTLL